MRDRVRRSITTCVIVLVAALFLAPLAVLATGSVRTPGLPPPDGFDLVPDRINPGNFATAARMGELVAQAGNSLLVVAMAVPVTVLISSWAGFAIITAGHRVRLGVIVVALAAFMVPPAALWVPRAVLLDHAGLTDRLPALAAPALAATSPFFVLLFALVYRRIPRTLVETGAVEGLSAVRLWWLTLPMARPAVFAVAVLAFVAYWSALVEPMILIRSEERRPLALGLWSLAGLDPPMYPIFLAGAVLATVPPALLFLLAQRAFLTRSVEP